MALVLTVMLGVGCGSGAAPGGGTADGATAVPDTAADGLVVVDVHGATDAPAPDDVSGPEALDVLEVLDASDLDAEVTPADGQEVSVATDAAEDAITLADAVPDAGPDTEPDAEPDAEPDLPPECVAAQDCADLAPGPCESADCVDGECVAVTVPDGTTCSDPALEPGPCADLRCSAGTCALAALDDGTPCEDPSLDAGPCREAPTCGGGLCIAPDLPDGTPCDGAGLEWTDCQVPACAAGSCTATDLLLGTSCDDANPCTLDDGCDAGACVGFALHGCDPAAGPESVVVIGEIYFDPPDNTVPAELIELHHIGGGVGAVDLAGWRFVDGVDYVFPAGAVLEPGGYLVVAQDPATVLDLYGVEAWGPWEGRLAGDGERVTLLDAEGGLVDEVDYGVGFPWPVASAGSGSSMELIDPWLDNDLGGSWRASVAGTGVATAPVTVMPAASWGWALRKGTSEPAGEPLGWAQPGYVLDESWELDVQTPVGYGDGDDNTLLADMQGNYTTLYLRRGFEAPDPLPPEVLLGVYVDDGAIVYVNGVEVARHFVEDGPKAAGDTTGVSDHEAAWVTTTLEAGLLAPGENLLAIHSLNVGANSSDLSIDARVIVPGGEAYSEPTPGAVNSVTMDNAPPAPRQVEHSPLQPAAGEPVVVSVKVTDPDGVASVSLGYQVVPAGHYVPAFFPVPPMELQADPEVAPEPNPAFEDPESWTWVALQDDGDGGDAAGGDDVWSVTLPGQANRTLVRYRITVTDGAGAWVRVPYGDDASRNFAYWVYDGVPDYGGHPAEVLESLPVYTVVAREADFAQAVAWDPADQLSQFLGGGANEARFVYNWPATFVYDGRVYDHIRFRLRGGNGRYQGSGKRKFRFRFHTGYHLRARGQDGALYPTRWRTLTTSRGSDNHHYITYDLNEALNYYLFQLAGVPSPAAHHFHLRVVDGAQEAPDPWHGDFWGLHFAFETYDVRFLDSHGLPKGNLYKLINSKSAGVDQQRYQGPDAVSDGSDHDNIEANLTGYSEVDWIRAHVDLDEWYRYHAIVEAVRHYDYWPSANKNAAYYFLPEYTAENGSLGKLQIFPFDSDASWGPSWNQGHDVVYNALYPAAGGGSDPGEHPELQKELLNVVRQVRDLLWQPDQITPLVYRFADRIAAFELADRERWYGAPASAGNMSGMSGPGAQSLDAMVQDLLDFAFVGGSWPGGTVGPGGQAAWLDGLQASGGEGDRIPHTPVVSYVGAAGYPTNGLAFSATPFSDPQGAETFAAVSWRLAEVTDPTAPAYDPDAPPLMEWTAVWESGELSAPPDVATIPAGLTQEGHTYRARARYLDDSGRWSHWSHPLELTAGPAEGAQALADGLRVAEVMYHPLDPPPGSPWAASDFEFVELVNVGPAALPLEAVALADAITLDLGAAGAESLGAGERLVAARSPAALATRYDLDGVVVVGPWTGKLDNAGETLALRYGPDVVLQTLSWEDAAPWPARADGAGSSLEASDPADADAGASGWRASTELHGSPGHPGLGPLDSLVLNEVHAAAAAPFVELHNPTDAPVSLAGWALSEHPGADLLLLSPEVVVAPGEYVSFDVAAFPVSLDAAAPFYLLAPGELFADEAAAGPFAEDEAWGRWPDAVGALYPMVAATPGAPNAGPRVGPVVLSEVHYAPLPPTDAELAAWPALAPADLELVEIYNPSDAPVDLGGWRLAGAVELELPDHELPAGGVVVAVPFDPVAEVQVRAAFEARYGVAPGITLLGPWSGKLRNEGETLDLVRAAPLRLEDRITWEDDVPWPPSAAGQGAALHRAHPEVFGPVSTSWQAAPPSPGVYAGP